MGTRRNSLSLLVGSLLAVVACGRSEPTAAEIAAENAESDTRRARWAAEITSEEQTFVVSRGKKLAIGDTADDVFAKLKHLSSASVEQTSWSVTHIYHVGREEVALTFVRRPYPDGPYRLARISTDPRETTLDDCIDLFADLEARDMGRNFIERAGMVKDARLIGECRDIRRD